MKTTIRVDLKGSVAGNRPEAGRDTQWNVNCFGLTGYSDGSVGPRSARALGLDRGSCVGLGRRDCSLVQCLTPRHESCRCPQAFHPLT